MRNIHRQREEEEEEEQRTRGVTDANGFVKYANHFFESLISIIIDEEKEICFSHPIDYTNKSMGRFVSLHFSPIQLKKQTSCITKILFINKLIRIRSSQNTFQGDAILTDREDIASFAFQSVLSGVLFHLYV
jgi:hypothetical protein